MCLPTQPPRGSEPLYDRVQGHCPASPEDSYVSEPWFTWNQ